MSNKMLIDATHPEETRVVVVRNGRIEEFDFESAARKLLRGNIYLAKVTRVEPSLQAAFVDYGGNRHGFLAFNEIHPDYYQIPVADRQALIDEEAAAEAEADAAVDRRAEAMARRMERTHPSSHAAPSAQSDADAHASHDDADDDGDEDHLPEAGSDTEHIEEVEDDDHVEEIGGEVEGLEGDTAKSDEDDGEPRPSKRRSRAPAALIVSRHDDVLTAAAEDTQPDGDHDTAEADEDGEALLEHAAVETATTPSNGDLALAGATSAEHAEEAGAPDAYEETAPRPRRRPRQYKIQEVIKRRQIILVQVVKEERGNKGAALTTYLSLAGRYTVLMPNTARGGGISRKITNPQDRRRLKSIAQELEVPEGMGLIIRTAGAARTKQEIKRDFEYLLRLWESVRELTLQSTAPSLVYEEGDLIKRSIRDLYNKDIEEVVVAGDAAHREAHDFMRMLMPSHARNVIDYKEPVPLFTRYRIENQLNAMFSPQVTLRSGGYIVINQTEALVAIDVNSGKSTREFSIEETALATNLEAAEEIARQLKLRDLAGLIVIDFIDMDEKRNNRSVERRLKDALRFDRARIQLGRISHFGLMEMSRQRLRTGVLEGSTSSCPHCQGTGIIRSTESVALAVLRGIEDAINAGANTSLSITTTTTVALYLLNNKRAYIAEMEERHGFPIVINGSDRVQGANFTIERGTFAAALPSRRSQRPAVNMDWGFDGEGEDEQGGEVAPGAFEAAPIEISDSHISEVESDEESGGENGNPRRRRRRRGGRRGERSERNGERGGERQFSSRNDESEPSSGGIEFVPDPSDNDDDGDGELAEGGGVRAGGDDAERNGGEDQRGGRRGRRRGRRGGRRGRGERGGERRPFGDAGNGEMHELGAGAEPGADVGEISLPGMGPQPDLHGELIKPGDTQPAPARQQRAPRVWDRNRSPRPVTEVEAATVSATETAANFVANDVPTVPVLATLIVPTVREPKPDIKVEAAVPETPSPAKPERAARHLETSEPRLERIVVGRTADGSQAEGDGEAPSNPQRKGWWQRRLGG